MQDEEKRKRSKNFSVIEASAFIELLTPARVRVIEDKSSHGPMVKNKTDCWKSVCHEFNALGFGIRTVAQLKEYWKRKKKELKKVLAEKKREVRGTGGGPSEITLTPFLQKMSDLIPRVYLDAPSALQNPYDSDRGLHDVVTTADNSVNDSFDGSYVSYLEQSATDKNFVSEVSASTALEPENGPRQHDTDIFIADSPQSKTDEAASSKEFPHAQGTSSSEALLTGATKNTPIAGRRQPLSEFQNRLLLLAETEHSVRMEILDLKRKYWKKKVTPDSS